MKRVNNRQNKLFQIRRIQPQGVSQGKHAGKKGNTGQRDRDLKQNTAEKVRP